VGPGGTIVPLKWVLPGKDIWGDVDADELLDVLLEEEVRVGAHHPLIGQ